MAKHKVTYKGSSPGARDVTTRVIEGAKENKLSEEGQSAHGARFPEKDLVFSRHNNWTLFLDDLDESAVNYFRNVDDEFSISEVKDEDPPAKSR
jgi:hypothetical protein